MFALALKYVVIINGIPIPIVRKETITRIIEDKATFQDVKEEVGYVLDHITEVLAMEGVIEILMQFTEDFDTREYVLKLKNILKLLDEGEKQGMGSSIAVRFEQSGERFSVVQAYDIKLSYVEPEPINTKLGFVYVYRFGVARMGRVGKQDLQA